MASSGTKQQLEQQNYVFTYNTGSACVKRLLLQQRTRDSKWIHFCNPLCRPISHGPVWKEFEYQVKSEQTCWPSHVSCTSPRATSSGVRPGGQAKYPLLGEGGVEPEGHRYKLRFQRISGKDSERAKCRQDLILQGGT